MKRTNTTVKISYDYQRFPVKCTFLASVDVYFLSIESFGIRTAEVAAACHHNLTLTQEVFLLRCAIASSIAYT